MKNNKKDKILKSIWVKSEKEFKELIDAVGQGDNDKIGEKTMTKLPIPKNHNQRIYKFGWNDAIKEIEKMIYKIYEEDNMFRFPTKESFLQQLQELKEKKQ